MGPKVKIPAKSAFSFFLNDYIQNERDKGRYISHKIGAEECASLWQELDEDEKEKYKSLAAAYKMHFKEDKRNKFTNTGISYAELERQQEELRRKNERADNEIKKTIFNLNDETLKTHLFYIIHTNYYCKVASGIYVPGELAIVEFSLGHGIRRTYHVLINPGQIPLGYAFDAKQTIEQTHGLPYPPYEEGESDYCGILRKILDFLEPGKLPDGRYPPLYCLENNIKATENILWALSDNGGENKNYFRVFLLHKMFFALKNKCVECLNEENVGFPVMSSAESEINKDVFCYVTGISCSFHFSSEEKYQNCSLSIVQRYVWVICDHCCQYIRVPLIPGQHCRLKCDTDRQATSLRIEMASRKTRASPPSSVKNFYDDQSSYVGSLSSFDWNRRETKASFLHEEIDSKFSGLGVSSMKFKSFRTAPSSVFSASDFPELPRRGVKKEEDDSDDDYKSIGSLGRGMSRR